MSELNRYRFFKSKAMDAFNRGDIEDALNYIYFASTIAWNKMLSIHHGIWYDDEMESLLFEISRFVSKRKEPLHKKGSPHSKNRKAVYIASHLYDTGGHSRVLKDWISILSHYFTTQYVYITNVMNEDTFAPYIMSKLEQNGAIIKQLSWKDSYIERIRELEEWIKEDAPDVIILFIHPNDVITVSTLLSFKDLPCIIFFNHADHSFWLGKSVADLFVEFRDEGARVSKELRKIPDDRLTVIPLTTEVRPQNAKRSTFQLPEAGTVSVSVGGFAKVLGDPDLDWFNTISNLLRLAPGHYHLFITTPPSKDVLDRYLPEEEDIRKRFIITGPFSDLGPAYGVADFLIETFPLAGGAVRIEAMACKLPIVAFHNKKLPTLTRMDTLPPDYPFLAFTGEQIIEYSLKFIQDPELRSKMGSRLYEYYKENFSPERIGERLISLMEKGMSDFRSYKEKDIRGSELTHNWIQKAQSDMDKIDSLSIIIVTYNSSEDIRNCLNSIFSFTSLPYEIIIIDNNSSDDTRTILRAYKEKVPFFIKLIFNDQNLGFSRACNQGIKEARGKYIVLLNPDTVVTPEWDKRMIAHFQDDGVGAVGPVFNYAYGTQSLALYLDKLSLSNGSFEITQVSEAIYRAYKGKHIETKLLSGFCFMTRRDVFERIGMLDEDLFLGNNDLEFSWRLRLNGYKLLIAIDVFVYHKGQGSFKAKPACETKTLIQESTDNLAEKLIRHYGFGNVPFPEALWGISWFRPSEKYRGMFRKIDKKVSIIILNYKQTEDTIQCLDSVYRNNHRRFQVVVVDNDSQDDFSERLVKWAKENGKRVICCKDEDMVFPEKGFDQELIFISNRENLGFAGGNNIGIRYSLECGAEYIWLLNNDTVIEEDALFELIRSSLIDERIGLISSKIYVYSDRSKVQYDGSSLSYSGKKDIKNDKLRIVKFAPACSLLIHRDVFKEIGLLEESYFLYFEDNDFCKRANEAGWMILYNPQSKVYHKGGTFIGKKWLKTPISAYYASRNFLYYNASAGISDCFKWLENKYWQQLKKSPDCLKAFVEGIKDFLIGKKGKVSPEQLDPKKWDHWPNDNLRKAANELINNHDQWTLLKFLSLSQGIFFKKKVTDINAKNDARFCCIEGETI